MSLIKYSLDYSALDPDETKQLLERIDAISYTGCQMSFSEKRCVFFLESKDQVRLLHLPPGCILNQASG